MHYKRVINYFTYHVSATVSTTGYVSSNSTVAVNNTTGDESS